jgi:hypothetical protein
MALPEGIKLSALLLTVPATSRADILCSEEGPFLTHAVGRLRRDSLTRSIIFINDNGEEYCSRRRKQSERLRFCDIFTEKKRSTEHKYKVQ